MPRWEPNAVGRLQDAAIELFEQQGLERTTVAQITERAGLTERTFFNHFATKTEVLFGPRSDRHREVVVREIEGCVDSLPPLDVVVHGLQAAADELFEGLRDASIRRRKIIDANPSLQEREEGKRAALIVGVAGALRDRGIDADTALLTARAGVLIEQVAEERWIGSAIALPFRSVLSNALTSLRAVVAHNSSSGCGVGREPT